MWVGMSSAWRTPGATKALGEVDVEVEILNQKSRPLCFYCIVCTVSVLFLCFCMLSWCEEICWAGDAVARKWSIFPVGARDRPGKNGGTGRAFGCSRWIHSRSTRSARSTRRQCSPVLFVLFWFANVQASLVLKWFGLRFGQLSSRLCVCLYHWFSGVWCGNLRHVFGARVPHQQWSVWSVRRAKKSGPHMRLWWTTWQCLSDAWILWSLHSGRFHEPT